MFLTLKKHFLCLLLLQTLTACLPRAAAGQPQVWIDAPMQDVQFPQGVPIRIVAHAAHLGTDDLLSGSVDGAEPFELILVAADESLARAEGSWTPTHGGEHLIQIHLISADGKTVSDQVRVIIGALEETAPSSTPTPEASLTPTTQPTPTETPIPSQTLTLSPTVTPTFTSTATRTFTPSPTPDLNPPPAPVNRQPLDDAELACASKAQLAWSTVSDSTGISEYQVEVYRSTDQSIWSEIKGSPITGLTDTLTQIITDCGWYYRFHVRAIDGAGNIGAFSTWTEFAVLLY
ncbi:MAG: fibronectin type III domain-containing protein [Anaerolineaceae bacterium]|nr:fibronectin type III domain-containing protein [Anaerolineaceae bacterium]